MINKIKTWLLSFLKAKPGSYDLGYNAAMRDIEAFGVSRAIEISHERFIDGGMGCDEEEVRYLRGYTDAISRASYGADVYRQKDKPGLLQSDKTEI